MSWPFRVTAPLLSTVDALTRARGKTHGWKLAEVTGENPVNVYRALERLRSAGWVAREWSVDTPGGSGPRRLYWLTEQGWDGGLVLLAERGRSRKVRRVPAWGHRLAVVPGDPG